MSTIFVRERNRVSRGTGRPRFVIVAALGTDLRVYARHIRRTELETLAQAAGAEIVYLPRGEGENEGKGGEMEQGGGNGQGRNRRRGRHGDMDQD